MKYTIIELYTDNQIFIDTFHHELKKGLVTVPKGAVKVIQFETEEYLEGKRMAKPIFYTIKKKCYETQKMFNKRIEKLKKKIKDLKEK